MKRFLITFKEWDHYDDQYFDLAIEQRTIIEANDCNEACKILLEDGSVDIISCEQG